mmetsp:Transcript_61421/g.90073  ORF Transcript_61421/g.90073 Transcript_61421/m.90073 type:complete len:109 (-) Transcript_61421:64-390(-)
MTPLQVSLSHQPSKEHQLVFDGRSRHKCRSWGAFQRAPPPIQSPVQVAVVWACTTLACACQACAVWNLAVGLNPQTFGLDQTGLSMCSGLDAWSRTCNEWAAMQVADA